MEFVCCAPGSTYAPGTIPEELADPQCDALTISQGRFGIRFLEVLFAPMRYESRPQNDLFVAEDGFTAGLRQFYDYIAVRNCPASVLVEIRQATVTRNTIYCSDGVERRTLYETARPGDREAIPRASDADLAEADHERFADETRNYLYLGSAGSANYGHWLVDDLPRAKAWNLLTRSGGKPLHIVMPSYADAIDRIRAESLHRLLRTTVSIEFIDAWKTYHFPRLFYASPVSEHPIAKSPGAIDYVVKAILGETPQRGQDCIYVRRGKDHGRTLLNEDDVVAAVTSAGYTIVDTDGMNFADQVATFSQAKAIIGVMGAAMSNTLFCQPGTDILYLAPHGWIEPFYYDLAAVRGHRYRVLFGTLDGSGRPPHQSDCSIDTSILVGTIAAPAHPERLSA